MSLIKPAKLLPIRFNLNSILPVDANGRQYRYNATLALINPQIHSDNTEGNFYNLSDLKIGDYVSTDGGVLKITTIGAQSANTATIIVEDDLRSNQQQDSSGNSQGYISSSEGIVFEVKEGRPILFPYTQYSESIIGFIKNSAAEIISKFSYLRQDKLISIEQAGSVALGLAIGDIVTWDDTANSWKLMTATDIACGVVVEINNPVPNAFRINPAGDTIDITLPDDGSGNLYYYWDVNNPGKLTQSPPVGAIRSLPMFLKLDNARAIHFDGADVAATFDQFVTHDTDQTITGVKTFTADTIFDADITVGVEATLASAIVSDLTNNRIVIVGTAGALEDDANLTFDGTTLGVGGNANITGNATIGGDLLVSGTTTTINTTNTSITDQLIELNQGYVGAPMSNDSGIVINRGPEDNLFFGWDEDQNEFTVGTGTFNGLTTGALTTTDSNVRFAGIKSSTLTDNRILISGTNGIIEDDVNLTWDGNDLSVTGTGVAFTTGKIGFGNQLSANIDHTMYVLYGTTANATPTALELSVGVSNIEITNNTTMQFEANIVGRNISGTKHCSYKITGVIDNTSGVATLVNAATETIIAEDEESWVATVAPTGSALHIQVTGQAATQIRWVAFVKTTSISF